MSWLYDTARNAYWRVRGLPTLPLVFLGHTGRVQSVAFLPDGKQVISGSDDSSIRAWSIDNGDGVGTVMKGLAVVYVVAASSDGRWIATGGEDNIVMIWNTTTHEKVVALEGHWSCVWSLAFSPDSTRVVSGSHDATVIVWSTTNGERLAGSFKGHRSGVESVEFSPDGKEVASCDTRDIRIWHSYSSELIIPPIEVDAQSLAWTPNGQQLIAGCLLGSIKFFDALTGSLLAQCNGHTRVVNSITVLQNGNLFASGSADETVRLWDATTRQQIGPALQHDNFVYSVAISPDGRYLVSGGGDRKVRIWSLIGILPQSFLENTSTLNDAAPPPVDKQLKKHLSKFLHTVTRKKKDRDANASGTASHHSTSRTELVHEHSTIARR